MLDAARPLLEAAREGGEIDGSLSLEQTLDLIIAIAKIDGTDDYRAPILAKALDAIATR